ncbi:hypothetical protein Bca101_095309 [Brassica carinata]
MNPMSEEGNQKLIHQGRGPIPALADEELMGDDDDDYDDLYSDVNVGEGFFQAHHQPQAPAQVSGGGLHVQSSNVAEPRMAPVSGGAVERKYEEGHSDVQANKVVPQGSTSIVLNTHAYSGNAVNVPEPPQGAKQIPVSQMNVNPNLDREWQKMVTGPGQEMQTMEREDEETEKKETSVAALHLNYTGLSYSAYLLQSTYI